MMYPFATTPNYQPVESPSMFIQPQLTPMEYAYLEQQAMLQQQQQLQVQQQQQMYPFSNPNTPQLYQQSYQPPPTNALMPSSYGYSPIGPITTFQPKPSSAFQPMNKPFTTGFVAATSSSTSSSASSASTVSTPTSTSTATSPYHNSPASQAKTIPVSSLPPNNLILNQAFIQQPVFLPPTEQFFPPTPIFPHPVVAALPVTVQAIEVPTPTSAPPTTLVVEDDFNIVLERSTQPIAPAPQLILHTFSTIPTPATFPSSLKPFLGDWYCCKSVSPPGSTSSSSTTGAAIVPPEDEPWAQFHYQHLMLRPDFTMDYEYAMRYGKELFSRGLVEFQSSPPSSSPDVKSSQPKLWHPVGDVQWSKVWSATTPVCKQYCADEALQVPHAFLTKVTFSDQLATGPHPLWKRTEIPLSQTAPDKYMCVSADGTRLFTNLSDPLSLMIWTREPIINPK